MKKLSLVRISDETPEPETGLIVNVHHPISQWGSLQVAWGQSQASSSTNAWQVELVAGDDAPSSPSPKRQKVAAPPSQSGGTSAPSHVH
ncbi:Auxin response factor [Hordeum vulgare]|nr:Auxin response factor [Hordeum vulgare]